MKDISRSLNHSRHSSEFAEEFTVKQQTVNGQFIQSGVGESSNTIWFPLRFIEKPYFSFGGELTPDSSAVTTMFPTISVVVLEWEIEEDETITNSYKRAYVGAILGVVTTGVAERMNVHWRFEGKGMVNPYGEGTALNLTI
jgi:hypothetical protein